MSTSSPSEGTVVDDVLHALALGLLHMAGQRPGPELRLERARRIEQQRVRAGVVAVGHDHDLLRGPAHEQVELDRDRSAGSRPAPAARARSPFAAARASPDSVRLRLSLLRGVVDQRRSRLGRKLVDRGLAGHDDDLVEGAGSARSAPARPRTSPPASAARVAAPSVSPSRCLAWSNRLTGRIAAVATAAEPYAERGGERRATSRARRAAAFDAVHHRVRLVEHHAGARRRPGGSAAVDHQPVGDPRVVRRRRRRRRGHRPAQRMNASVGPFSEWPPTSGLTATTGAAASASASRMPGTARIGPMLAIGFEGPITIASAPRATPRSPPR